jgi:hypothetical protein
MTRYWLQIGLVGLGAGACSALVFAAALSSSVFAIPLFCLAPLPIMIVARGWSHWSGLAAALVAALALTAALGTSLFLAFLFSIGLPAWWLGYLALLARTDAASGDPEWYPPGRLVLWASTLGSLVVLVALSQLGGTEAAIKETLGALLEQFLRSEPALQGGDPLSGLADAKDLPDLLVRIVPPAAAVLTTITQLFNLWLAGRIARISGRLPRPWPDVAAMRFPRGTPFAFAAAFAAAFLPGIAGIVAALPAATLLLAYAALGFAVLHGITRDLASRAFVLAGIYATVAIFRWPLLVVSLIGLVDVALDLRRRVAATRDLPAQFD